MSSFGLLNRLHQRAIPRLINCGGARTRFSPPVTGAGVLADLLSQFLEAPLPIGEGRMLTPSNASFSAKRRTAAGHLA